MERFVAKLTAQMPQALETLRWAIKRCARERVEVPSDWDQATVATVLRLLLALRVEAEGLTVGEISLTQILREPSKPRKKRARRELWPRIVQVLDAFRARHEPSPTSAIFGDEHRWVERLPLDDASVFDVLESLAFVEGSLAPFETLQVEELGHLYEATMGLESRRRAGSHYTSRAVAAHTVERTLAPLLKEGATPERILALRVCDPAMGSGAMLLAACRYLAERLVDAWRANGWPAGVSEHDAAFVARRLVARHCLYGLDKDPFAVDLARLSLWLVARPASEPMSFVDARLRLGDALIDRPISLFETRPFVWEREFAEVFERRPGGFDAIVGNPPWISYVGRAAQPIEPELKAFYAERYEAFSGYRNLQGLFVERAATLLREGGRLGLVLPSSMSEQQGYGPTRLAHDRLCEPDAELSDLGEGDFEGVFQPSMVLTSTRRAAPIAIASPRPWPIERPDLDSFARQVVAKMSRPPLPPHLFADVGLHTMAGEQRDFVSVPTDRHTWPLRSGSDVYPFLLKEPSYYADPSRFGERTRTPEAWRKVRFFVRQTARFPMAALSDGLAFRNSLLAGFEDDEHPAAFLAAYLNASPIRFLHYVRHRDARQGMPQVKIGHLRAIPAPPTRSIVPKLAEIGERLARRNEGIDEASQRAIDELVADAFDLTKEERARIERWAAQLR